jgi:hypothetical protein
MESIYIPHGVHIFHMDSMISFDGSHVESINTPHGLHMIESICFEAKSILGHVT